jgi:hypothetical protein
VKVNRRDVDSFTRRISPPPPPVEPRLSPEDEATLLGSAGAGADDVVEARRARVLALLRRPAPLDGADAELVALLALARTLPIGRREDRLSARERLREIGNLTNPPPQVAKVAALLKTAPGGGTAFAPRPCYRRGATLDPCRSTSPDSCTHQAPS